MQRPRVSSSLVHWNNLAPFGFFSFCTTERTCNGMNRLYDRLHFRPQTLRAIPALTPDAYYHG